MLFFRKVNKNGGLVGRTGSRRGSTGTDVEAYLGRVRGSVSSPGQGEPYRSDWEVAVGGDWKAPGRLRV